MTDLIKPASSDEPARRRSRRLAEPSSGSEKRSLWVARSKPQKGSVGRISGDLTTSACALACDRFVGLLSCQADTGNDGDLIDSGPSDSSLRGPESSGWKAAANR